MRVSSVVAVMFLGTVIPSAVSLDSVNPDLILTNIDRKIDLSTQLVKVGKLTQLPAVPGIYIFPRRPLQKSVFPSPSQVSHAITVSNGGSGATKSVHFTVEKEFADKVVFIEATAGSTSDKTYLRVSETKLSSNKASTASSTKSFLLSAHSLLHR